MSNKNICSTMLELEHTIVTTEDLPQIKNLQPDGWPDICNDFEYYINNDFCYPIKVVVNERIVGLGVSIIFDNTAWLAHIIVDENYRNRGIGFEITNRLIEDVKNKSVETVLLIATKMGVPVYKKSGFREISDYINLKREKPWREFEISKNIIPYKKDLYSKIVNFDKKISGEDREVLIKQYIENSLLYIEDGEIKGYYLPDLGEGLIFAENSVAGTGLMKIKYSKVDKAVLPAENKTGIEFLELNGFVKTETKGKRMVLGKDISWKPESFYSRIGGNFG